MKSITLIDYDFKIADLLLNDQTFLEYPRHIINTGCTKSISLPMLLLLANESDLIIYSSKVPAATNLLTVGATNPNVKLISITPSYDLHHLRTVQDSIMGYCYKGASDDCLKHAILSVLNNSFYYCPAPNHL